MTTNSSLIEIKCCHVCAILITQLFLNLIWSRKVNNSFNKALFSCSTSLQYILLASKLHFTFTSAVGKIHLSFHLRMVPQIMLKISSLQRKIPWTIFSLNNFEGQRFCLWGYWHLCFGLLVIFALGFKARVDPSLACFLAFLQWIPQIHLWCDTCWPLGCQHGNQRTCRSCI